MANSDGGKPRNRSKRTASSEKWLRRQRKDPFAKQASKEGKTSRAHFKLAQLDERFRFLRPGRRVLELGAAPGGWSRYIEEKIHPGGLLVAVDFRPVKVAESTVVIEGLLGEAEIDGQIELALASQRVDLVLSDMAPNISGIRTADQAMTMELVELAEVAAQRWLKPGGYFVVKIFQGDGIEEWISEIRKGNIFTNLRLVKPKASRPDSREMYAVAQRGPLSG